MRLPAAFLGGAASSRASGGASGSPAWGFGVIAPVLCPPRSIPVPVWLGGRRAALLLLLLLSLVTCHLSLVTAASAASSRLICDAPSFDAGPILPAPLTHEYVLRNDGDAPLEILNARASDGDFRLSAPSAPIPPGESGILRADFTPIGRSGPHSDRIIISSNDPENPVYFLSFRCDIVPAPAADPSFLRFGRLTGPDDATRTVTLTADRPFSVLSATTARPQLSVQIDTPEPALTHVLTVTVLPTISPGPFGDTLTVELDLPVHPILHIPLVGDWHPAPPPSSSPNSSSTSVES